MFGTISEIFQRENIQVISMHEYRDTIDQLFYLRIETGIIEDTRKLREKLYDILPADASVKLSSLPEKKVIIMVSKEYHCLGDILIRNQFKTLGASVQCVIGNDAIIQNICERFEIPFHLVSHEQKDKISFENELLHIIRQYGADYLVLAKFMRILSPEFISQFPMRIINIHHSFLPAFAGANPYRQAFHRGVKLIGATAHLQQANSMKGRSLHSKLFR